MTHNYIRIVESSHCSEEFSQNESLISLRALESPLSPIINLYIDILIAFIAVVSIFIDTIKIL